MIIDLQRHEILTEISDGGIDELKRIEKAARVCYKSEDKIVENGYSAEKLIKSLIENGHDAMLEHSQLSVKFICDRGVSHELVRHRVASFAQESTRYCNYSKSKFGNQITVIAPREIVSLTGDGGVDRFAAWWGSCKCAEENYLKLINQGVSPQIARGVLPTALKTEIVVTANYREWRHIFKLRCDKAAHPQMRELMIGLLKDVKTKIPIVFDDISFDESEMDD